MRHMRSRRILAMLLALSMIFGLLTTTAFAGEVDQNTSNVGESAANGTSEGGSGEGQSSGASEDESSKATNKEDVPTEEETIPEEKKTTSDEEVDTQEGEGENAVASSDYITVNNDETQYATLEAAIAAAEPENGVITYTVHGSVHVETDGWIEIVKSGLTDITKVEFVGASENAEISTDAKHSILNEQTYGVDVIFDNLTLSHPNGEWVGNTGHGAVYFTTWVHDSSKTVTYTNCKFPNGACNNQYGKTVYDNCKFTNGTSGLYNLWNYGGNTEIKGSTFTGVRGIKTYNEGTLNVAPTVKIESTTFDGLTEKAAVVASKATDITFENVSTTNCTKGTFQKDIEGSGEKTTVTANGTGISGTFNVTADKGTEAVKREFNISAGSFDISAVDTKTFKDYLAPNAEISADGTVSSGATPATGVATVGGVSYDTLKDAFAALSNEAHTLTLNDESAWDVAKPVYWAAGTQSDYAATLAEALTAAYKANAGDITIICRPGADVGEMTHGHVADNLTIYGNKAYISGGECDLEVDTFKFDRNTGKQATDGVTLDKDITITAYELDNLGVWGERHTNHTVNVNLTDCDTVQGITVQRVYISGKTGVNNITLSGCDFGTKATSVYSNADGDINITDCSFTGAQVPVNFNHKAGGEQTLRVSNCEFNACGEDEGDWAKFAAPVRFVNSGSGKQSATVDTCTFADTVGNNGDILIGDGRTGEKSNDVNLTVTDTEANIQAQKPGYYNGNETDTNKLGTITSPASGTMTTSVETLISGGESGNAIVDEKTLRKALFDAPTDGTETTIKLENDITLEMLYAAENFDEEKLDDNAAGDTFNRYKRGVHPTAEDPNHWNPLVTNQTQDERVVYGANYHMSATDERIARLVVKADQNIVLDLNGHTIQKNSRATHGDWSNTCTDILANYGTLTITDTSTGAEGTIKGNGYISCDGAVLHNYAGATMNVGAINVDGNAAGMSAGTGQYVVVNDGGTLSIDGANIFDTATSASLLVNTTGTMSVKNATLSHPATKTFNVKGGTVEINEGVEITSDTYAIYVASGTVKLNANVSIKASSETAIPGTLKIEGETAKVEKAEGVEMEAPAGYKWENNVLVKASTGIKGTEANPYTLEELGEMTRAEYIAAQKELNGTMYVTVGNYSYDKDGVLGNGTANNSDRDSTKLNYYGAPGAKSGQYSYEAVGKNVVFVGSSITSGVKGYTSIDNIGTSLLLAVPAYTNVTFKGITFNNVMCFNYQLYTSPWSQLGELKFDGCTFNGIIIGSIAAQTLTFNGCTFTNFTNTTDANSSNPTWIRPAYGNWTPSDNKGQGSDFRSLTTINFTNNKVTSTRPVKFEYVSQWDVTTTIKVDGNTFNISKQEKDGAKVKNVGMYFGSHTDENAFNLILGTNEKLGTTAALYTLKENQTSLPAGSTVTDLSGKQIEITDALEWKTEKQITLKTEPVPAVKNVAMVGDTEYATLEEAIANAVAGQTVTLIADVNTPETTYVVSKDLTIDLNGKTVTGYGYDGVFQINGANANVLIKNGNVVAVEKTGSEGKYAMAVWACAENCEVTLEDLTVTQDITHTDDKQMDMIYTSKGTIIINSGSFTSGTPAWTLNCKDAAFKDGSAKIIVNGGTFTGFDPCNNAAEGKGTSFVAEGVGVDYDENGSFTAKAGMVAQILDASGNSVKAYTSLADAIAAAAAGQTVRLLADATEDVTITKNITLDLGGKMLTNTGAGKATITIANGATATVKNGSVVGGTSYYNIQNNGTATFEGLTATAGNDGSSMIDNYGTLTITSGEYTGGLDTIKNEPNAKLTVDGGTFTLTKGASKGFTGVIFNYGELTINDGTFIQSDKSAPYGQAQVIHTDKSGSNAPSTVIKGGTFKNLCTRSTAWTVRATNAAAGATKVSGGTFNKSISEDYCADGFIPTKNADGTYGVKKGKYVATVDDTGYETLAAAVKTKINGKTVMLLDDVTENIEITKAKNFTLDLNGHTINGGTVKDKATITNYGTVTIIDSSAAKTGTIKRDDNGTVGETSYYVIRNIGTMTIEQANVTNNSGYKKTNPSGSMVGSSLICNGDDDLGGTLNISGGKFEQKNFIAIKNGALGKLNVTGGTISSDHSAIQNWFEATITGGEINGQLWTDAYIADESVGHTTIGGSAKYTGEIVMDISGSVKPTLEISGGTLDVTNWRITTAASKAGAKPAVSGGTFSSAIPYEYCAAGYIPADKGDGKYGVKEGTYVAEVNGKQYETLQAAIDAASRKQTVKLIADTTENVTMGTPYLTLDLNGHTLNGGQVKGKPALTVTARVTVMDSSAEQTGTIKRDDTAENSGVSSHYVIDVQGDGWLTFESGNVTNDSGVVGVKGASLVRVGDDSVEKYPGLNIKGGNFKQDNFIAIKVDRGDLFLNGGTITSKNSYAIENWHRATIKGGTVKGSVASWTYSGGSNSTTTIIGGTINGNVNSVNYGNAEGKTAKVTISGGTVNGELDTRSYDPTTNELTSIDDAAKATIGVTGGTFSKDPTKYVVEGSSVTTNSDGTFGVEKAYLCKVGETKYYTMEDAFKAQTTSGEPIVLLRDYTTGSSFPSGSINRTVDLDGHTWTYTGSDVNSAAFEINYPNVTLTVKNGTVVSNSMIGLIPSAMGGKITYDNSGLVFESVEATANGNSGIETNGNNTNDTVTLKNSTLNVPNGFGIYFPSSGKLTIDNSKITAMTMGVQVCSGSLDIKGQNAAITVNGDPVPKTENDGAIQDGAAISIVNRAGYKGLGTITVTEGTFKAKSGNAAVKAYNWANQAESDFTASDKVAISGGTFSSAVAPEYCAEGFEPKDNGDGTYGVQPDGNVAEIGSVKYASLDEALKAAKDRETVKLLKDVEATQVLVTKGTLDLNGKTLKVSYFMSFSDVIDSTDGNGLIETGVQSFFTTNNSYLPLRDSAANGYRLFSYKLNKLGVVEGSSTAFWFNIVFGGKKAYSLLNTAGHNADLFIPMQIGSGNEWQYIKMNQSTLTKWTTPILNGTAPSKCGYYVNITGLDTLTSGTVLTLKTSIRSCGVEKLSDDSLTYTVK